MVEGVAPQGIAARATGWRVGEYELLSRIAAGGMGEVFVARKTGRGAFDKRVALKLLLPHLSEEPELVRRFLDEARITARMNHPNLVQVFDVGEADGRHYLAMALVEGVSLARLLAACRRIDQPLPVPIVRLVATGLCEGLAYAHDLRDRDGRPLEVVHRDINPYNVLVSTAGAVLVTDFGIAQAAGSVRSTRPGRLLGKLAYLAPEQLVAGAKVDRRVDLYAAALTIYETATGVSPFERDGEAATLDAARRARLPDPRERRSEIDARLAAAILRGADRDPTRRFSNAKVMLEALLDGPVARPSELGELVQLRCAEGVDALRDNRSSTTGRTRTRSLGVEPTPPGSPGPSPRLKVAAALLSAGLMTAVSLAFLSLRGQPPPVSSSAPAAGFDPSPSSSPGPTRETPGPDASGPPAPSFEPSNPPIPPQAPEPKPSASPSLHRREKAASVAPKRVRIGYLSADASPWASVIVDGKEIDQTPLSRYPLPVGTHQLVFRNPALGKELRRSIRIEENRVKQVYAEFGP